MIYGTLKWIALARGAAAAVRELRRRRAARIADADAVVKEIWVGPLVDAMTEPSPLLDWLDFQSRTQEGGRRAALR